MLDYITEAIATEYVTEPVVRIEGVTKDFATGAASFRALDDVSLEIHRGEMIAIMGPSGSGKSTLMTIIGLLDSPTSGNYWLDGQDVGGLSRLEQARVRNAKIGFVFQNFNLLPRLSALKNVELPMVYGRIDAREREQRARAALEAVGLGDKLANRPNELSGGQNRRARHAHRRRYHESVPHA
jgi:putative ABC transport system ATP-binding protein